MAIIEAKKRPPVAVASVLEHPALTQVLQKVHLADDKGNFRQSKVEDENLGLGPLLDLAVIEKFGELDTTRDLSVLAWMLFEAGGGSHGIEQSEDKVNMCRRLFIQERTAGRGEDGAGIEPMTMDQAEDAWTLEEPTFRRSFFPADQDLVKRCAGQVYGFERNWPGYDSRYERVYTAVSAFLDNITGREGSASRISMINMARQQRATRNRQEYTPVKTSLADYNLEQLEELNDEFKYFFKRRTASRDVQFIGRNKPEIGIASGPEVQFVRGPDVKLIEDDNIVAYIPATAAAMMKVGFDNWCVANKTEFERAFHKNKAERATPRWTRYTQQGPFMVIHCKKPVPEQNYPEGHEWHQSMKRIAVYMPVDMCDIPNMQSPYPGVQFFDKINRNAPRPVDYEELMARVRQVPGGRELAISIDFAMQRFVDWAKQMKDKDIKSSVYERLAAVLVYDLLHS